MDNTKVNKAIGCTVDQCEYHSTVSDHCALDQITVGTHESDPTDEQCTDCMSFEAKKNS